MRILSIGGFFHDLNFAYHELKTSIILSVEEERFSRIKMHSVLDRAKTSINGINWMLDQVNVSFEEIDILIFSDSKTYKIYRYLESLFPNATCLQVGHYKAHIYNILSLNKIMENADIYCFDAFGDGYSGCIGEYKINEGVYINEYFSDKNSLGLLYTSATYHLGLGGFGSEGKLQGLAAYGKYKQDYSIKQYLTCNDSGPIVDPSIRQKSGWYEQEQYVNIGLITNEFFGSLIERRFPDESLLQRHSDFAYTIQSDIFNLILEVISRTYKNKSIIISGGLAQNSSLINYINKKITAEIHSSTSCSDRGNALGALGAYLYENLDLLPIAVSPFLGYDADSEKEDFSNFDILAENQDSINKCAQLLVDGEIVATYLGKAELGSRALCNRSILSSATDPNRKDFLNRMVKHRELFRPFAPVIKEDKLNEYSIGENKPRYMIECIEMAKPFLKLYPSAVHIDGTSRLQVISKTTPVHYRIQELFDVLESVYDMHCLLNTSFNDAGEPIVNNLKDAIKTMKKCNIKYLLSSSFLLRLK